MKIEEYQKYDGMGLADLVHKKEVTPAELLALAIDSAEKQNPELNAINYWLKDFSQKSLKKLDLTAPFAGVPFVIKDLLAHLKDYPMSDGSNARKNLISKENSTIVDRYIRSGLIIFAKTNTPEFGLMGITEPKAFGPTKSIYGRTSGGSSGGSGACVGAKIVPMAAGGDGGGSLRIPAACNGVFALKPSRGLNPTGPQHGECWDGATSLHILSRSVRDSAHMLDITARKELGSPYPISFGGPYLNQLQQKLAPQKISFSTQHPLGFPVDQACKDAVLKTVNILEDLGHHVEEKQLPINFDLLAKTYLTTMMGHMAYELRTLKKNNLPLDIELTSHLLGILGESITAGEFVEMKTHWHRFALAMEEYHLEFPMHICPVIATPPPVIGQFEPSGLEKKMMEVMALFKLGKLLIKTGLVDKLAKENLAVFGFTQLSNLTGHPSISLPHYYSQGLPIGVQVMSSLGKDLPLLQLAQVIEAYTRWND